MKIRVLFFAQLREALGAGERSYELPAGARMRDVVQTVLREPPAQKLKGLPMLLSLNECFVRGDATLQDRDVVALLPPVAGG